MRVVIDITIIQIQNEIAMNTFALCEHDCRRLSGKEKVK